MTARALVVVDALEIWSKAVTTLCFYRKLTIARGGEVIATMIGG